MRPYQRGWTHKTETFSRGSLENTSDDKDRTSRDDGPPSTKVIGKIARNQSSKERSGRQDGSDERLLPSRECELLLGGRSGVKSGVKSDKV